MEISLRTAYENSLEILFKVNKLKYINIQNILQAISSNSMCAMKKKGSRIKADVQKSHYLLNYKCIYFN